MNAKVIDRDRAEEAFDNFLMRMDDQIEALEADARARGVRLDLRIDRLGEVERYFNLVAQDAPNKEALESTIVSCARYLGEAVRLRYGGKWVLPLDDSSSVNFNVPVIVGHTGTEVEFSPISVMRAYSVRRRPNTLARAVASQVDFRGPELDDLIER